MSDKGTLEEFFDFLLGCFSWLEAAFLDVDNFAIFFQNLGWYIDPESFNLDDFKAVFSFIDPLLNSIESLGEGTSTLISAEGDEKWSILAEMASEVQSIIQELDGFNVSLSPAELPSPLNDQHFIDYLADFPLILLNYLIATELEYNHPRLTSTLMLIGVLAVEEVEFDPPQPLRIDYTSKRFNWEKIGEFFIDPKTVVDGLYNWNVPGQAFEADSLLVNLERFLIANNIVAGRYLPDEAFRTKYFPDGPALGSIPKWLRIPLYEGYNTEAGAFLTFGLSLYPIAADDLAKPSAGLYFGPFADGNIDADIALSDTVTLSFEGDFQSAHGVGIEIRPNSIQPVADFINDLTLQASAGIMGSWPDTLSVFDVAEYARISLSSLGFLIDMQVESPEDSEISLEAELGGGQLIIAAPSADSFLAEVLPPDEISTELDFTIGWSSKEGIYFGGSAALEVTIPLHLILGPINLDSLYLQLSAAEEGLEVAAGVTLGAELGPLTATIDRIGVKGNLLFPRSGSDGDAFRMDFSLLLPTGVGFGMDASWVSGGGFLDCDHEKGLYSGALAIEVGEIGVTAIGLITTKLPDGSDGFSMLVSICVTFEPAIQLYMGFTLAGVGGLIGVNRSMKVDVLREGLKKGTLDSILFPDPSSVIANVNQIISDMKSVFPAEEGRFVIGPMITLGWGTPTIITGEIGVFIAVPEPVRIALIGQVEMAMPDSEHEIVGIHVDILGVVDFEKKELSLQAAISGSSLKGFELEGDCAFFLRWGSDQEFALSIGGFHPSFTPPAPAIIFNDLRRLGANIQYGPAVELQCQGYLALTPNSLQFGSRVGVFIGISEINAGITGFLGFDGMIIFSPFAFEVGLNGGVTISVGDFNFADIRISCTFSGPEPWNITGTATVSVLFLDLDCGFDILWGTSDPVTLETVKLWPKLEATLERAESWGSRLPDGASAVVALRPMVFDPSVSDNGGTPETGSILVHPGSLFEIRQNVAPTDLKLDKIGNAPIEDYNRFKITGISTAGGDLGVESIDEYFARGQYVNLTNQQKLSSPSFEKLPGGVRTETSNQVLFADEIESTSLGYESILIQSDQRRKKAANPAAASLDWSARGRGQTSGNAVRRGALHNSGSTKFAVNSSLVGAVEEQYVVVNAETLIPVELDAEVDVPPAGMTRTQAEQVLAQQEDLHPEQSGKYAVVAEYEAGEDPPLHMELHQIVEGPAVLGTVGPWEPL